MSAHDDLKLLLEDLTTRIEPMSKRQTIGALRCIARNAGELIDQSDELQEWAITATFFAATMAVLVEHLGHKTPLHSHRACTDFLPFVQDAYVAAMRSIDEED